MAHTRLSSEEIAQRGKQLYELRIRDLVEGENKGKFLLVDVETGEYEMDTDMLTAYERARKKHDDPALFILRIGYPTAVKLGGKFKVAP